MEETVDTLIILNSVKKALGLDQDYHVFDPDIVMAINTAFFNLWQLGVGPDDSPFTITGDTETWSDFIEDGTVEMCKSYVYLKVKLLFDPPTSSFLIENIKEQIREYEFRMMCGVEEYSAKERGEWPTSSIIQIQND